MHEPQRRRFEPIVRPPRRSFPVVVIEDAAIGRAARPRARRRRTDGDRDHAPHRAPRSSAIEAIAGEVEGAIVGAGTVLSKGQLDRRRARRRAASSSRPASTPTCSKAADDSPVPFLPGAATASEAMQLMDARLHDPEILPGRAGRRHRLSEGARLAASRRPLLPDRRHRRGRTPPPISRSTTSSASAAPGSRRRTRSRAATGRASRSWRARPPRSERSA